MSTPRSTLQEQSAGLAHTTLQVEGMDCADEVNAVERAIEPLSGVQDVRVNLTKGEVTVLHEPIVEQQTLIDAIRSAGLKVRSEEGQESTPGDARRSRLIILIVSGIAAGAGLLAQWTSTGSETVHLLLFAAGIISGGWFIFPKALRAIRHRSLDMNVLMVVAVAGAAAIGEWSEGAVVTFLFGFSEFLEAVSLARARRAIRALMELTPETAWLKRGDSLTEVPVAEVKIGDMIVVKSGSRVPLDGDVISGSSAVNQAPITGESMPVQKETGDGVFAGTINGEGSLEVRVSKGYKETTLARMIELVEVAQSQKAPSQRFVDTFARYYTPAVVVVAVLVLLIPPIFFCQNWAVWTYRALVLLVIACPCALVISTPVSVVSGLTAMARRGVLIKGGAFLEAVGRLRALAVDKTGTITEGKPRVLDVVSLTGHSKQEIARIAAAIDSHSEHPLAKAVVRYAEDQRIQFRQADGYQARTGRGAEGTVDGHRYFVGNHRFAHEMGVCTDALEQCLAGIETQARSVVVLGHLPHGECKGEVFGVLAVGDAIRADAVDAIRALHSVGIRKVVMLSGDNQRTVDAIARQAGIDEAYGDLLPDKKIERVRDLLAKHKYVGMIGDGVNDAPAMAAATVGIAMGVAGTDAAIETADIALMRDDLKQIAGAAKLGRRTLATIRVNIAFAITIKAVFLALALFGLTSLWLAILADTGATLVVIANALRLLKN